MGNSVLVYTVFSFIKEKAYVDALVQTFEFSILYPIFYLFMEVLPFTLIMLLFSYKRKISISTDISDTFPDDRVLPPYDPLGDDDFDYTE